MCARIRARGFSSRIDTLAIASVLPGIADHYRDPCRATACRSAQPRTNYVRSASFEFDLHESKLEGVGVDDVVCDAGAPRV